MRSNQRSVRKQLENKRLFAKIQYEFVPKPIDFRANPRYKNENAIEHA